MARVSVVMPVYNVRHFLDESISSVLGQTWKDLELICVDDGSTDGSAAVLDDWCQKDDRVLVARTHAGSPGRPRNVGVALATGEYLAFVDSDDVVPPYAMATMIATLDQTGSDLVAGRVMRISTNDVWPSFNQFRAITGHHLGTHISRTPSLLYDTTSWNKLIRRSFWDLHELRFPEGELYEDVGLMAKMHWEARSVDLLPDIVYFWRRRDRGDLSITQRNMDLGNFRDRIKGIRRVQEHLFEAPSSLRDAAHFKALRHDLAPFLQELPFAEQEFVSEFVRLVGGLVEEVPPEPFRRLPPLLALEYRLVEKGATDQLMRLIEQTALRHNGILQVRGKLYPRLAVPGGQVRLPLSETSLRRRLPVICGVDHLRWDGDILVIGGHAAIEGVPFDNPAAGVRRLRFSDSSSGRAFSIWLAPRKNFDVDIRRGRPDCSYRWSGFEVGIPATRLAPQKGKAEANWRVSVQLIVLGAAKGSSLGPPTTGDARDCSPHFAADHLQLVCSWRDAQCLHIRARRATTVVCSAVPAGGSTSLASVRLELRASTGKARPSSIAVRSPHQKILARAAIRWSPGGDLSVHGEVDVPLAVFEGQLGSRPYLALALEACGRGMSGRLSADLAGERVFPGADHALVIRASHAGDLELVLVQPRVVVDRTDVQDGQLKVCGRTLVCNQDGLQLVLRNGTGQEIPGDVALHQGRFEARFPLLGSTVAGLRCISSGWWRLVWESAETWEQVQAVRGSFAEVERSIALGILNAQVRVDQGGNVALQVFGVSPAFRGPYRQAELLKRHYHPGRVRGSADLVLFETWAGRSSCDNPGALLAAAVKAPGASELAISIADESISTPPGVRRVIRWTPDYYQALGSARLIVANDPMPKIYAKGAGQRYLQTWHGTPLKLIGFDTKAWSMRQRAYQELLAADVANWDWLLSPNSYSTEILRNAFRFDGPVWETGYPRNDVLLADAARDVGTSVRLRLGIADDETVILWAPTWRDDLYGRAGGYALPALLDVRELVRRLPHRFRFLIRGHHLVTQTFRADTSVTRQLMNVSHYPDVNDLYLAADVLVTDYSSAMFDFALTGKPIVNFVPDIEHYRDTLRGLYLDLNEIAPGPVCAELDELIDFLGDLAGVSRSTSEQYARFQAQFCSQEDGHSSERVWELLSTACPSGS